MARMNHIVVCRWCGQTATRWWPAGDGGADLATCDLHKATDKVDPVELPTNTTYEDYLIIRATAQTFNQLSSKGVFKDLTEAGDKGVRQAVSDGIKWTIKMMDHWAVTQ